MSDMQSSTPDAHRNSLELTEQLIRKRAFAFYELRGCEDGHDLEDWFKAEAEILGRKARESEPATEQAAMGAVAA